MLWGCDYLMKILEENDWFVLWEEDGIYCSRYKKPTVDLEMAKMSVAARLRHSKSHPCKLFLDIKNLRYVSQAAREYSASDESIYMAQACAVLAPSRITKLIANFFLSFNKPKIPFQIFTSKEKAFEWLKMTETEK